MPSALLNGLSESFSAHSVSTILAVGPNQVVLRTRIRHILLGMYQHPSRRITRVDATAFFLIAAIVAYQLMMPPVVSLADNGDFGKVLGHFSIGSPQATQYAPVKRQFDPAYRWPSGFRSSETLLTAVAVGLSSILSKSADFDVRCIGAIHAGLFLWATYLLLPVLISRFE